MWHWTGLAVGLAQTLGLHQSKTYAGLQERQQKLWRRIWWTVYVCVNIDEQTPADWMIES